MSDVLHQIQMDSLPWQSNVLLWLWCTKQENHCSFHKMNQCGNGFCLQSLQSAADQWDERLADLGSDYDQLEDEQWFMPGDDDEGEPWTARNSSELTPIINKEIMWLLQYAEDRIRNASGVHFSLKTARNLAMYTSIGYCLHENIQAWNCSR